MKYILLILLIGCTKPKTDKNCYICTFGVGQPAKQVCINEGEDINKVQFKDNQGNDLTSYCTKQ